MNDQRASVTIRRSRGGWSLHDDDGRTVYGPTYSMTDLERWVAARQLTVVRPDPEQETP